MAETNPFYRFEDAPQAVGIGPGATFLSNILQDIYDDISSSDLTGYSNIYQLKIDIQSLIDTAYNQVYQTNFSVRIVTNPVIQVGYYLCQLEIYEPTLTSLYEPCRVNIVVEVSAFGVTIGQNVTYFGPITGATYNYDATLYDGERLAYRALLQQYETGGASFPPYYQYDSTTGIAKSYIARFKDCKYDESRMCVVRVPQDQYPRAPFVSISATALTPDEIYILSLFDSLIENCTLFIDMNDVINAVQLWDLPSGYTLATNDDFGAYERFQVDVIGQTGRTLTLVSRLDPTETFLFQRFYAPNYGLGYNILGAYLESTQLPYEPNTFNMYGNVFYDFEMVGFSESCIEPREFYPMPIKPGDSLRFNIKRELANIFNVGSCNVGLFDSNYNLVQKIGSVEVPFFSCCTQFVFGYDWDSQAWEDFRAELTTYNDQLNPTHELGFVISDGSNDVISSYINLAFNSFSSSSTITILNLLSEPPPEELIVVAESVGFGASVTATPIDLPCLQSGGYTASFVIRDLETQEVVYQLDIDLIQGGYATPEDAYANVTIPSKTNGCYRFGLYNFGYSEPGIAATWIEPFIGEGPYNEAYSPEYLTMGSGSYWVGENYCVAIIDTSSVVRYLLPIPNYFTTWNQFKTWFISNVRFGEVVQDSPSTITYNVWNYISMTGWTIEIGEYDFSSGAFVVGFAADEQSGIGPLYPSDVAEVYSLSNILNLDSADCFSNIIKFWSEDNSMAEGFQYFNGWKQVVRLGINGGGEKPVITESVYRQSNGVHKRPQNKQDLSIDLHTDFIDFETQCALVDATRHPYFVWNNQSIFVNGDIEVATNQDFSTQSSFEPLSQVKFQALKQGYQPKNSSCLTC